MRAMPARRVSCTAAQADHTSPSIAPPLPAAVWPTRSLQQEDEEQAVATAAASLEPPTVQVGDAAARFLFNRAVLE